MAYNSAFTSADLISAATVAVTQGIFTRLGAYVIKAGEQIAVGAGQATGQESAFGRIYIDMRDNTASPGAKLEGLVRLSIYDAQDMPIQVVFEARTEQLRTDAANRTLQIPFPMIPIAVTEDKKWVLEFKSDTSATVGKSNTNVMMSVTRFNVR